MELLREVFDNIDKEGKGYFTKDELFFLMESMGGQPTPQVNAGPRALPCLQLPSGLAACALLHAAKHSC